MGYNKLYIHTTNKNMIRLGNLVFIFTLYVTNDSVMFQVM